MLDLLEQRFIDGRSALARFLVPQISPSAPIAISENWSVFACTSV